MVKTQLRWFRPVDRQFIECVIRELDHMRVVKSVKTK